MKPKPKNIDEYIAAFPKEIQQMLEQVRLTIKRAAPEASEGISYSMPTFTLNRSYLIYFAAYKKHIGLYPAPAGDKAFEAELLCYRSGKGTIRFPLNKPLPLKLITEIVKLRMKEN